MCLHALGLVHKKYGFVPSEGTRKYTNFTSTIENFNGSVKRGGENLNEMTKSQKVEEDVL